MSLNLYFEKVSGKNCLIDFPFQTPSWLTMDVMNASTLEDRLQIIRDYLKKRTKNRSGNCCNTCDNKGIFK